MFEVGCDFVGGLWVVILGGSLWGLEVLGLLGSFGVLVWGDVSEFFNGFGMIREV